MHLKYCWTGIARRLSLNVIAFEAFENIRQQLSFKLNHSPFYHRKLTTTIESIMARNIDLYTSAITFANKMIAFQRLQQLLEHVCEKRIQVAPSCSTFRLFSFASEIYSCLPAYLNAFFPLHRRYRGCWGGLTELVNQTRWYSVSFKGSKSSRQPKESNGNNMCASWDSYFHQDQPVS